METRAATPVDEDPVELSSVATKPISSVVSSSDSSAQQQAPCGTTTISSSSPPSETEALLARIFSEDGKQVDMQLLMLSLWRKRRHEAFTRALGTRLAQLVLSAPTLEQVELYLPQLAHMVIHLEKELPIADMEQFVLLLSQSSVHFALQLFWALYAALDEHRPKRNGNPRTFARCAQLLLALEQCVVYGSPAAREASELLTRNSISRAERDQILQADRRFFAAQSGSIHGNSSTSTSTSTSISAESEVAGGSVDDDAVVEGWLYKKGGGTSKMGRRNWSLRWCRIEKRMLLVFTRSTDVLPRTALPLDRADVRVVANAKHAFHFELHHEFSESTTHFAAQSHDELVAWVRHLSRAASAPRPPPAAAGFAFASASSSSATAAASSGSSSSTSVASPSRTLTRMSLAMREFILDPANVNADADPVTGNDNDNDNDTDNYTPPTGDTQDNNAESTAAVSTIAAPPPAPRAAPVPAKTLTAQLSLELQIDTASPPSGPPPLSPRSAPSLASRTPPASPRSPSRRAPAPTLSSTDRSGAQASSSSFDTADTDTELLQAAAATPLGEDQKRRYEFFTGMIQFVKAITDVSEALRRVEPPKRKAQLQPRLSKLVVPRNAYLPLCRSTDPYCRVLSVFATEGRVFSTNERAPCLLYFDTEATAPTQDVTHALFNYLYAHHADSSHEGIEVSQPDASAPTTMLPSSVPAPPPSAQMSPFLATLLASPQRRQRVEKIFGELSFTAAERLRASSSCGAADRWRLCSLISKSYDDLRQEVLVMQLISFCHDVFARAELPLRLLPYRILSTGASTGLIEVVRNATSLDALKKTPGFKNLRHHFEQLYGGHEPGETDGTGAELLRQAELNFVHSLAAYSILCYMLSIKDRHNGNIMLDVEGHIVHIDFGFFLGRAPGGSFSFETAPFKLTAEMVDVLGGRASPQFRYFSELCVKGALAVRRHADTIYTLVEVMSLHSKMPCFLGNTAATLAALRDRLFLNVTENKVGPAILGMIERAYDHFGTNKYDQFQVYSNGIAR